MVEIAKKTILSLLMMSFRFIFNEIYAATRLFTNRGRPTLSVVFTFFYAEKILDRLCDRTRQRGAARYYLSKCIFNK